MTDEADLPTNVVPLPQLMTARRTSATHLPGVLGALARAGHGGAALLLAEHWGGQKRYIPATIYIDCPLAALIGIDAARVVSAYYTKGGQGGDFDIPKGNLKPALKRDILGHPAPTRETARALGCTERYVRKVRQGQGHKSRKRDPRQSSLFD